MEPSVAMEVDDQQVQRDHELALSLALRLQGAIIPLPADFWETSLTWMAAARDLAKSFPDIQDFEFLDQVVDELGETVRTIDEAIESLDLSDALLPQVSHLLSMQWLALEHRYFLGNRGDFLRALHLLEVLPQLFDPTDTHFSRNTSNCLTEFLGNATRRFLDPRRPSEVRLTRLIESCGIPSDFMTRAETIVEQAHSISHIPDEVGDCSPQSPIILDIDWIVASVDSVIEQCDHSDPNLEPMARLLTVQVLALQERFRLLGSLPDLERSVSVSEVASQFHGSTGLTHHFVPESTFNPFDEFRDNLALDASIAIGQGLLKYPHEETRILVSLWLARLLQFRFIEQDNIADGEQALQLCESMLPFVIGEDRHAPLRCQVACLSRLSSLGKQVPDLRQSLEVFDEDLGHDGSDSTESQHLKAKFLWTQLGNAAVAGNKETAVFAFDEIQARGYLYFEGTRGIPLQHSKSDIPNIIDTLTEMCVIHSKEEAFKPFAIVLVIALFMRYVISDDAQYLQEALSLRSQLGPPGLYGFDLTLYEQATINHSAVEQRSEQAMSIAASSKGFFRHYPEVSGWKARPGQREILGGWFGRVLNSSRSGTRKDHSEEALREMRMSAYERNGDDQSFQISRRELFLQLSASQDDPGQRSMVLDSLGGLFKSRHERQHEIKDLEQALDWYQQAIDVSGEDNQTSLAWCVKISWAGTLFKFHEVTNSVETSLLLRAHDYYHQAAASTCNPLQFRLIILLSWLRHLPRFRNEREKHIPEVCELAMSLIEEQSWAASSLRLSLNTRHEDQELGSHLVYCVLWAGRMGASNIPKAIELTEASQGLAWGQLHRLRAPLGDLEIVSPVLASRFRQLSGLLESRMGLMNTELDSRKCAGGLTTNNLQLNHDMNEVIKEIRTLPGFEKFLQRRSFEEDDLREIAKDGPVVTLLSQCLAVIILQDRLALIHLPITVDALRSLHESLRYMANARDAHGLSDLAEGCICTNTVPQAVPDPSNSARAGSSRSLKRGKDKPSVENLLEVLWERIVEPILVEIFGCGGEGKGKSRMWKIPKLEGRQRIWWCCLGEFSFLPIHAAGIYSKGSPICLSDFFLSSYTPTLTALSDARARPTPPGIKILAAAQPNPGMGWSRLAQVKDELKEIVQIAPPANLIFLGESDQPDFEGHHTSVKNVLKKLPEASILHLACHGTQNPTDPLNSGFILADAEELTIEELMKYRLPYAHTAILSACHTASNDVEQPHEAINLSSALLFLGFSNILATKWPMSDSDGPVIAKAVYEALFNDTQQLEPQPDAVDVDPQEPTSNEMAFRNEDRRPTLASFSLAKVVDSVARQLRLRKVPAKRWATFVHVGI